MKKTTLVVVLALVLVFAFATSASATTFKGFANSIAYYQWNKPAVIPPGTTSPAGLFDVGSNPTNPGAHANYLATTAKCGMCHSVHRAAGAGVKLLPTADATCAGCHTGSTAITAKIVTWSPYDVAWVPTIAPGDPLAPIGSAAWLAASASQRVAAITNKPAAGGAANGGGPHNDSALDLIADGIWDGTGATPEASFEAGHRYGCFTRRCHATNPHGAGASKYKLFAAKLLFNNTVAEDDAEYLAETGIVKAGTYGGQDAMYDAEGAIDASVDRFIANNPTVIQAVDDGTGKFDLQIKKVAAGEVAFRAPDANETHSLVAGLTCGRPSNPGTGEDECHAEASYAIFDKDVKENRNKSTGMTDSTHRTDNTGNEALGFGGNDSRTSKTGHVAGTFAAQTGAGSYAAIAGCVSCHDQKDGANTVFGNYTFPHGQVALGATNLHKADGTDNTVGGAYPADISLTTVRRARIWMGFGANTGAPLTSVGYSGLGTTSQQNSRDKAFDGNCLKCHRDTTGSGIGLNF